MPSEKAPSHGFAGAIRELSIRAYAVSARTNTAKEVPQLIFVGGTMFTYLVTTGAHIAYGVGYIDRAIDDPFAVPALGGFIVSVAGMLLADKLVTKRNPPSLWGKVAARSLLRWAHELQANKK